MSSFEGSLTDTFLPHEERAQRVVTTRADRTWATGRPAPGLRAAVAGGVLMLVGYVALFTLLLSRTLWESPSLVPDRWKPIFSPLRQLFDPAWLTAKRNTEIGLLNSALYLLVLALLFGGYVFVLRRLFTPGAIGTAHAGKAYACVLAFASASLVVLMVTAGTLSQDLFSYIWYGRIFAVYGENPFTNTPAEYAWSDLSKWLQWVYWKETPSVYGPVWLLFAGAIANAAQAIDGDIVTHLLGHKLLAGAAHLINIWLLWKVAGLFIERYRRPPDDLPASVTASDWQAGLRVAITTAYAWNPLALIEFGVSGHNDVLLVTGLLAALWLHMRGHWRLAVVCIALASMVKVIAVIFLPGYLWLLFWQRDNREQDQRHSSKHTVQARISKLVQGLLIFAAAWVVMYIPFWDGPATLQPLFSGPATHYYIHSLGAVLRFRLPEGLSNLALALDWQPARFWSAEAVGWRIDAPLRWSLLTITAAVALLYTWPARTLPSMVVAWGWVVFAYLTVGSVWFWPWYVAWLLVPAMLAGTGRLFIATQILCATSLTLYAIYPAVAPPFSALSQWTGAVIMVPPLLYVLVSSWREAVLSRKPASPGRKPEFPALKYGPMPKAVEVPVVPAPIRERRNDMNISAIELGSESHYERHIAAGD